MKALKKLSCVLLAVLLVLSLTVTAFAAADPPTGEVTVDASATGQIQINDAIGGQTYTLYRLFDFVPVAGRDTAGDETNEGERPEADAAQGLYTVADGWEGFLVSGEGHQYFTWLKDAEGNDTKQITGINEGLLGDAGSVQLFAQKALAWAKDNKVASVSAVKAEGDVNDGVGYTVTFKGLPFGYYLIDSTTGALVSLDTAGPDVVMKEKNEVPTIEKKVEEDSTGTYGATDDADAGQIVNYKSTIKVEAGAENYVLHDTMTDLKFVEGSVKVYVVDNPNTPLSDTELVPNNNNNNYTVKESSTDDTCTFEVVFDNDYVKTLSAGNTWLIVTYQGKITNGAIHHAENKTTLEYGDEAHSSSTPESKTDTYTFDFDVFKYEGTRTAAGTDPTGVGDALEGATFVVYKESGGEKQYLSYDEDNVPTWTPSAGEIDPKQSAPQGVQFFPSDKNGKVGVSYVPQGESEAVVGFPGLDADTYYVEEIEAPAGYNKADKPFKVTITAVVDESGNRTGKYTVSVGDKSLGESTTVNVPNYTGLELPETGGIGTTIFYVVGGLLVAAALVLLITKKRMTKES